MPSRSYMCEKRVYVCLCVAVEMNNAMHLYIRIYLFLYIVHIAFHSTCVYVALKPFFMHVHCWGYT